MSDDRRTSSPSVDPAVHDGEFAAMPKRVVGLRYQPGDGLPEVIVKGAGPLAEEILRQRKPGGPRVIRDDALVDALFRLPLDGVIGPELYPAVAALLAHVFAVDGRLQELRR